MNKRAWIVFAVAAAACHSFNPNNDLKPGQTDFVTLEPSYGEYRGFGGPQAAGGEDATTATPAADKHGAPSGRTSTVQEADIYRIDNNRLFYFNTYRGFMVYDLNDAKNPTLVSRLGVYGYPIEMYVEGNIIYALIRDALYLKQTSAGAKYERHDVSQLITIDVSDIKNPKLLKSIDIIGQLREGVSRKIDNTIYVVSYIPQGYYGWWWWGWDSYWWGPIDTAKEQAWVYSFNTQQTDNPQLVDKLQIFEGGSVAQNGSTQNSGTQSVDRYFQGIAISATSNTLHVVENWQTSTWSNYIPYHCGSYASYQQAVVSIIDISNPSGKIRLHTKFNTYGNLTDQFKHTYVYDDATKKGTYLGIFARQEWYGSNCSGGSFIQNQLEAWDITDGDHPQRVGALPFGDPNETVGGSIFDPGRKVALAVTSHRIDPLYALSFADVSHLKILSQVDGLSGSMSVFRFINNKFAIGVGIDQSDSCNGVQANSSRWHTGLSVSILDVQDLNAIRLVQRGCLDVENAEWVSSQITQNLDQAHKMVGMYSDDTISLISVPVSYYSQQQESNWWWYRYQSAVGMMSWDLSAYDPSKKPDQQTVLKTRATVLHPDGAVRRTILFSHQEQTGNRRMMLNLSDTSLSMFDIQNADHPVLQSTTEVAPDVEAIFKFGDYLVEHVRAEGYGYGYDTASEFRIKPASAASINDIAPIARFSVGQVQRVMKWKNALLIFRSIPQGNTPYNYSSNSQLVAFDLSDPTHPALKSLTTLPWTGYPYFRYWCGGAGYWGGWWWGGSNDWTSFDGGLVATQIAYNYQSQAAVGQLAFINLADLSAPVLKTHAYNAQQQFTALVTDESDSGAFFLSYRNLIDTIPVGNNTTFSRFKYYAQRWTRSGDDIKADAATNVPGQLVRSWKSGDRTFLVTQDSAYRWQLEQPTYGYWQGDPRLHLLGRTNDSTAALQDSYLFGDRQLSSLVGEADRIYVTSTKDYLYYATPEAQAAAAKEDRTDALTVFDTSAATLARPYDSTLGISGVQGMGTQPGRLFLNISGGGVLVVDTTDASKPFGRTFLRTLGWGSYLEFSGSTLYAAAGNFGVFQKSLEDTALAP